MNDKMRAEFEAWAVVEGLTLHGKDGRYLKEIQSAWMAWQASRAALVIELPERIEKETGYTEDDEFYNLAVDRCQQAIEAAGVRAKP